MDQIYRLTPRNDPYIFSSHSQGFSPAALKLTGCKWIIRDDDRSTTRFNTAHDIPDPTHLRSNRKSRIGLNIPKPTVIIFFCLNIILGNSSWCSQIFDLLMVYSSLYLYYYYESPYLTLLVLLQTLSLKPTAHQLHKTMSLSRSIICFHFLILKRR